MEEIEASTEHLHEEIKEHATAERKWSLYVAISTALMAVFASIASLMAGHDSNEALIEQIKASDKWAYYQAKGIKQEIANLSSERDTAKISKYKKEQTEIKKSAEEEESNSKSLLEQHVVLARAVTLFQVAIAISSIAIITNRKVLWYLAILIAFGGLFFFCHMYWT